MEIPTRRLGRCLFRALVAAEGAARAGREETAAGHLAVAVLVRDTDRGRGQVTEDSVPVQGEGTEAQAPATADPGRENRVGASAKLNLDATME
jgi:hypothetical protein